MAVNKNEQSLEETLSAEMIKYVMGAPQAARKTAAEVAEMKTIVRTEAAKVAPGMLKDLDLGPEFSEAEKIALLKTAIPTLVKPIMDKLIGQLTTAPTPVQPAAGDAEVLAAAAGTTHNHYYGSGSSGGNSSSSTDEWGVGSYLLLAAAAGAVCYGGYKLFSDGEAEDLIAVDLDYTI